MNESRKKLGVTAWIIIALVALLVTYPMSFGPACWVCSRVPETTFVWEAADFLYAPLLRAWYDGPATVSNAIGRYANLGAKGGLTVARMLDASFCIIHAG